MSGNDTRNAPVDIKYNTQQSSRLAVYQLICVNLIENMFGNMHHKAKYQPIAADMIHALGWVLLYCERGALFGVEYCIKQSLYFRGMLV